MCGNPAGLIYIRNGHRRVVKAQLISSEPKEVNLSITEADIGILYIVQHEILNAAKTNFAGVIVKHPLTNECWMKVGSSAAPIDEIQSATESAMKTAEDLKELFHAVIKVD